MNARGVDTIEKLAIMMNDGFEELRTELFAEMDTRFNKVDARFDKIDVELAVIKSEISEIKADIAELKEKVQGHDGYTKEIDYILSRVARIEEHLGLKQAA